ncbi:hypothetical protein HDA40_006954 [Hamadaea flava]|uniref:ArsR family transcriptional regulator n=1 Tax=Hamadaea flava TaxID=1742688 RepID=A0ABV8M2R6_9ACTN|nr:hypothetical protein [Hamadaea flava]MCP2328447.1 hypothetical protein [Hamadaea flava]
MLELARPSTAEAALCWPLLGSHSAPRQRIFDALLAGPKRVWTVSALASEVPDVSVEAVRTTLYLMMGDQLVEVLPGQRNLTLRLTRRGIDVISEIIERWAAAEEGAE